MGFLYVCMNINTPCDCCKNLMDHRSTSVNKAHDSHSKSSFTWVKFYFTCTTVGVIESSRIMPSRCCRGRRLGHISGLLFPHLALFPTLSGSFRVFALHQIIKQRWNRQGMQSKGSCWYFQLLFSRVSQNCAEVISQAVSLATAWANLFPSLSMLKSHMVCHFY